MQHQERHYRAGTSALTKIEGRPLTAREEEVVRMICNGLGTKEVARELDMSLKTAESHRSRIYAKLGVHCTALLVRWAIRTKLVAA